ncbi:MAG: bifunctional glutamate N-acetyltransferase/amino-acid acetyltransferase ArgJ [Verrucomicrobiota bacterium]|nr:bifunctional glutamate N-acetyltransferase/amino-acid acetyltransferase ArgJ [Verrucomicrobiota bacterium]
MSVLERIEKIKGGITAPRGFSASGVIAGIKPRNTTKKDVAIIFSEQLAVAAGTFTTNQVKAAPVRVSQRNIKCGEAYAIIANSGNANACTGVQGVHDAQAMVQAVAEELGAKEHQILVCSTGRIGVPLPMPKMIRGIKKALKKLSPVGSKGAAEAIMTSDTVRKEFAIRLKINNKRVTIGGIAKGAGMIDPNMATMLAFITTDVAIDRVTLQRVLSTAVDQSFNSITIDGDMSTNDTVLMLANGLAQNEPLSREHPELEKFQQALNYLTRKLAHMIVRDGEGVTKFVEVVVRGAGTQRDAKKAAEAIANSTLVKCSWFGGDANWGRLMDAIGYSGAKVREEHVDIFYDGICLVQNGMRTKIPEPKIKKIVAKDSFTITVNLHLGNGEHTVFTTDLTEAYVDFNKGE